MHNAVKSNSSTSPTRKVPKKSILKNSNRRSIATSNASDLIFMNTSPPQLPEEADSADYNKFVFIIFNFY